MVVIFEGSHTSSTNTAAQTKQEGLMDTWYVSSTGMPHYPRSQAPPQLLATYCTKMRGEPGRFNHVHNDALCTALCMVW